MHKNQTVPDSISTEHLVELKDPTRLPLIFRLKIDKMQWLTSGEWSWHSYSFKYNMQKMLNNRSLWIHMSTRVSHYASTCGRHFGQNGQKPHGNYKIQNQHFFGKTVGKHLKWQGRGERAYFGVIGRIPPTRSNPSWCA